MDATYYNGDDDREQCCTDEPRTCECPDCRAWRDNVEPGDPDGEDFRGGERAAYDREQMAQMQRLK